jgi:hypothetical protein
VEVEFECACACARARVGEECVSHEIFAVTPMLCDNASNMPSRTCWGPPIRSMRCDCESPGMRRAGDVKIIRRDGYGLTRKY